MQDAILFEVDYSLTEPMPVERNAKIFEAGEYPDKDITVTEEDLDAIVANFREAPVKVEHTDSPLDPLGTVKRIWRRGRELFARLAFPVDVAQFLERRGVKKLSIALLRNPLRLAEVSLVLSPRVSSAAMFGTREPAAGSQPGDVERRELSGERADPLSEARGTKDEERSTDRPGGVERADSLSEARGTKDDERSTDRPPAASPKHDERRTTNEAPLCNPQSEIRNPKSGGEVSEEVSESTSNTTGSDREQEIAELKFALKSRDVEARLAELRAAGKLVPASESLARAILLHGDQAVTFSDGESTTAELFIRFLEAQPKVIEFAETAPASEPSPSPLAPEDEELLAKLGVTREKLEKYA